MLTGLFEDARFGSFSNVQTFISLVEVYRFGQCLGWRFSPIFIVFFLAYFRAFRDAPHSRFRCWYLNLCLKDFLRMLGLALSQIYTRAFHLWKSIDLHSVWVGDSRAYQLFLLARVLARLEISHTRVLGAEIPANAYLTF